MGREREREREIGWLGMGWIDKLKESTCLVTHIFKEEGEEEEAAAEKRDIQCIKPCFKYKNSNTRNTE